MVTAMLTQKLPLLGGFHPFGHHFQAQIVAQVNDGRGNWPFLGYLLLSDDH